MCIKGVCVYKGCVYMRTTIVVSLRKIGFFSKRGPMTKIGLFSRRAIIIAAPQVFLEGLRESVGKMYIYVCICIYILGKRALQMAKEPYKNRAFFQKGNGFEGACENVCVYICVFICMCKCILVGKGRSDVWGGYDW